MSLRDLILSRPRFTLELLKVKEARRDVKTARLKVNKERRDIERKGIRVRRGSSKKRSRRSESFSAVFFWWDPRRNDHEQYRGAMSREL